MLRYRYGTLDGFTFWELDGFVIYVSYFFHVGYGGILYCVLCHQVETFYGLQNHGTLIGIGITVHEGQVYMAAFSAALAAGRGPLRMPGQRRFCRKSP